MLEELSGSLPRFKAFEDTLTAKNEALENALLDVYVEIICFCARTITFFRSNPHKIMLRSAWPSFDNDFKKTIKRLRALSQVVEQEAEAAKMRLQADRNTEILSLMQSLKLAEASTTNPALRLPCFHVPFTLNQRCIERQNEVQQVAKYLDPEGSSSGTGGPLRSLALYGTGGVGKTQIALQYAYKSRQRFDAILWISADNNIKMEQDFLAVAQHLGLVPDDGTMNDVVGAMSRMKSWLADTTCRWLLIFDNADGLEVLQYGWPRGCEGSILVTTRDATAGLGPVSHGLQIHPFDEEAGANAFLFLLGQDATSISKLELARDISRELGGLPLALGQMSGFISQQRLGLDKFLPLYRRNQMKIHQRKTPGLRNYGHTLGTTWEVSLSNLTDDAATLQRLLAFMDPDQIHETILVQAAESLCKDGDDEYGIQFMADELDFLEAKEALLRAALIDRSLENETLSVHRLVQVAVINQLQQTEKELYFNAVIDILLGGFPSSWTKSTSDYVFNAWEACQRCIRHVHVLALWGQEFKLVPKSGEKYVELLNRAAWYHYETEHYIEGKNLLEKVVQTFDDKTTLDYARTISLYALLQIDTNRSKEAVPLLHETLNIREKLLGPQHPRVGVSYSNLGMCYTELEPSKITEGMAFLEKSVSIRLISDPAMVGNTYSNIASLLLRMGRPDEAEKTLGKCPSLKDMTNDACFLRTDNPRFSSDMFLLSRIREAQGRTEDALRLGSKALEFRRSRWGNGLKTCASLCHVATLLHEMGNTASALKLLEECIIVASSVPEAQEYHAYALFLAFKVTKCPNKGEYVQNVSLEYLNRAITAKKRFYAEPHYRHLQDYGDDNEMSYSQLVPWMIW